MAITNLMKNSDSTEKTTSSSTPNLHKIHSHSHSHSRSHSHSHSHSHLFLVACTCALTAFHFGYAISSINVPSKVFITCTPDDFSFFGLKGCFEVSPAAWGLVGMGLPLGGWIGGSLAPSLVNYFDSLKVSILFLNIPLTIAYALMSLASNLPMLVIGRCFLGFAAGASGMMVPLYLSSISPLSHRGLITNFFQLFLCSGAFIAECICFWADLGNRLWMWRLGFAAGLVVVLVQMVLNSFGFLPESPRDLDTKNPIEASNLRQRLGIFDDDLGDKDPVPIIRPALSPIPEIPSPVSSANDSLINLITFRIPAARKSLILGIVLHFGQQISGVNSIFFYSTMIVGDSPITPIFLTFVNLVMTVVAIWLLDRAGRRVVALCSVAGSAACLFALAGCFLTFPPAAPLFLVAFVACFAVGLGPIPWMLVPEIFPPAWPLTPSAISICVSANWITNIVVSGGFPLLAQVFKKDVLFLVFGASCTFLFIFLSQWLPETKNRSANFI